MTHAARPTLAGTIRHIAVWVLGVLGNVVPAQTAASQGWFHTREGGAQILV